jgi:hypothetical protein
MRKFTKMLLAGVAFALFFILDANAQSAADIGAQGDLQWKQLIDAYTKQKLYVEYASAKTIVKVFENFQGKYMLFPEIVFEDFVTDKDGKKYYYYGQKNTVDFYVIEHNPAINTKLQQLYQAFNLSGGKWEVLGSIEDAYRWWGNVVLMKMKAMRIAGVVCILINDDGSLTMVGQDVYDKLMAAKEADQFSDVPKNLKAIPKGLEPLKVAKLYLYLGSVEINQDLWWTPGGKRSRTRPAPFISSKRTPIFPRINRRNTSSK